MLIISRTRIWSTFIICLIGFIFALPSFVNQSTFDKLPKFMQHSVSLGLELRGGSHIQLEVGIDEVAKEFQEGIVDEARKQLRKQNINYKRMAVQKQEHGSRIIISSLKNSKPSFSLVIMMIRARKLFQHGPNGSVNTGV